MGVFLSFLRHALKTLIAATSLLKALSVEFNQALKRASQPPGLPNPDVSRTYWLRDPPFPELTNVSSPEFPKTADVAIIGSGICGAAIARSLLHERRRHNTDTSERVVVLEARQLSSGATARNGGHIKSAPYESFSQFCKTLSKDRAAALTRFQKQHLESLINLCQSEGIEAAEARKVETVDLFLDDQTFNQAVKNVDETKNWVPDIEVAVWDGAKAQKVWLRPRF